MQLINYDNIFNQIKIILGSEDDIIASLEAKVSQLEALATNTGNSFDGLCNVLDGTASGADTYHCCVNGAHNKMYCAKKTPASVLGISVTNGPDMCDRTDTATSCLSN